MSESQSRYSIVERLTQSKLDIIDELNNLDSEVENKKIGATRKLQEIIRVKRRYEEDIKREVSYLEKEAELLNQEAGNLTKFKDKRKEALEEKKTEIDNALTALQEISKSASNEM